MGRIACRLAIAFFWAFGPTAACFAADEPVKTAAGRDTLLYVRTDPPGATVTLDGKKIGTSNGLFPVESGVATILVDLQGHMPTSVQVTIQANHITRVKLILKPAAESGENKETAPPRPAMPEAGSRQPATSNATVEKGGMRDAQPTVPTLPKLSYQFQDGRQYAYEIKIEAELQDTIETREGVSIYDVLSANQAQMVLKQSGALRVQTKPRPGHHAMMWPPRIPRFPGPLGFPGFGPSGPEGITINHEGHLILSKPLTQLPFLLGDLETLVIEELPADGKASWQKLRDVLAIERKSSGFPPMGLHRMGSQSERPAKEQIDYAVIDAQPDAVRIKKNYSFRSAPEADGSAHFDMSGSGEFTFDRRQGMIRVLSMKYTVTVNEPNLTLRVPVSLNCRLLTAEELAAHKRKEEENRIAVEKANAPKPLDEAERTALLAALRSTDQQRVQQAAERLAKAIVDTDPAPVARALVPLLHSASEWVARAAAKALAVWGTPESEDALIEASTNEDFWIRTAAMEALGKLKSKKAADAVAAQMYRNQHEAGEILKHMGRVAETATIGCLKDRDHWVRSQACQVLGEIGHQASLKALRQYAERATGIDQMEANRAIEAIEKRIEAAGRRSL